MEKICNKCKTKKSSDKFSNNKKKKDKLSHYCKDCCKIIAKKYKYKYTYKYDSLKSHEYHIKHYNPLKRHESYLKQKKTCSFCRIRKISPTSNMCNKCSFVLTKKKLTPFEKGEKHINWKGGKTKERKRIQNSDEYKLWRKAVYERDNYTCMRCGERGGTIHAHHIKPFSLFPELRLAIDNGQTLCIPCHKTTDTYAGKIKTTSPENGKRL